MTDTTLQHGDAMTFEMRPFGRVARSVVGYAVATAVMLITPPLLVFAPAALFHCAMRNGRRATWAAALLSIVGAGAFIRIAQIVSGTAGAQQKMSYASFLVLALSIVLPAVAVLPLVERREGFGTVLVVALIGSAAGLAITELVMRSFSFSPYLVQAAETQKFADAFAKANGAAVAQSSIGRVGLWMLNYASQIVPAVILFDMALVFVLSLMMYGRLSAWRAFATTHVADSEARRAYLFRNLALPDWFLFVFVIGGLAPALTGLPQQIAANALAIALWLYALQGIAVFRSMLVRGGAGFIGGAFAFFLLAMLCLTGIGLMLLALAGLFDPFFDFRHLKRKDDSHESHTD